MARASRISNIDLGPVANAGVPITNFDAVNQTIDKAIDDRNQLRSDIEDLTRENTFKLEEEFRKYQEQAANNGDAVSGRVISACENVSQRMLQYNKKYRRGEVSRDQYLTAVNNMNRASVQIATFVETADKFRLEAMARQEKLINEGTGLTEGSKLDAFLSDEFQQYKNLVNSNFYVASDGNMFFGKVDPNTGTMSKNPANFASVSTALTQPQNKYLNKDLDKYTTDLVEGIGTTIKGFSVGKYKTIEDAMQDPAVSKYIEDKWSSFTVNPENALSVITDQGVMPPSGGEWGFTYDATEADDNKDLILLKRNGGEGNRVTIETNHPNFQEGVKLAKERYTQEVAAKMKRKEVPREYKAPSAPSAEQTKTQRGLNERRSFVDRIKLLAEGTNNEIISVEEELTGKTLADGSQVLNAKRTDDGVTLTIDKVVVGEDGKPKSQGKITKTISFGQRGADGKYPEGAEEQFVRAMHGLIYGNQVTEADFAGLKLSDSVRGDTGQVFETKNISVGSQTAADYDQLSDVTFSNMNINPDTQIVGNMDTNEINKIVSNIGGAMVKELGANIDFGGLRYFELEGKKDTKQKYGLAEREDAITFNYLGKTYMVGIPTERAVGDDELAPQSANDIKSLLRFIYESARIGREITPEDIKNAVNPQLKVKMYGKKGSSKSSGKPKAY